MCDYSAMGLPNRLAKEGEDLVSQYCGGHATVCFVNKADQDDWREWYNFVSSLRGKFMKLFRKPQPEPITPLVCIPPGAKLKLSGIPPQIQRLAGIKKDDSLVVFDQLPPTPNTFLDGVIFPNGKRFCLQHLGEGVGATVLSLDGATHREHAEEYTHAYNAA